MKPTASTWVRLAGVVALAHTANAQGFIATEGDVLAAQSDPAPGLPPGIFIDGSGAFSTPVMDSNGTILFRARLVGAVSVLDDRAYYAGTTKSDLALVARGGDQAPGLAAGITLNSASSQGLSSSFRLSPIGDTFWASRLDDGGATVTSANDSAYFSGMPGGTLGVVAREGDPVPTIPGASFGSLSSFSTQSTSMNGVGAVLFKNSMTGTPGGSADNDAWFWGSPGSVAPIHREGDTLIVDTTTTPPQDVVIKSLGFISQMNGSSQVLHESTLLQTVSTTPPTTAANDKMLFVWSPGLGDTAVVREGQLAPDTGSFFANSFSSWSPSVGPNAFNALGQFVMNGDLFGGDAVIAVNDRGTWISDNGGSNLKLLIRRGDDAPGVSGAKWNWAHGSFTTLNIHGQVATQGALIQEGAIDDTNDTGIWITTPYSPGVPGTPQLIVREGDPVPGMPGMVFDNLTGSGPFDFNNKGQLLFRGDILDTAGGPPNTDALWTYDPVDGLRLALVDGEQFEISPGVFKTVSSWGGSQFNNGDGAALTFSHDGVIALKLTMVDGSAAIVKAKIRSLVGVPPTISTATGGVQDLYMNAGPAHAGGTYLLVGSLSGTSPGIPVGPGQIFPLNFDPYLDHTLVNPNAPPLTNSFSTLDGNGRSTAAFTLPTGWPGLAGTTAHHAFAVLSLAGVDFISVAEPLTFLP